MFISLSCMLITLCSSIILVLTPPERGLYKSSILAKVWSSLVPVAPRSTMSFGLRVRASDMASSVSVSSFSGLNALTIGLP